MRIYLIMIILVSLSYGCTTSEDAPTNVAIGNKCAYDTECVSKAVCDTKEKVCIEITALIADSKGCEQTRDCTGEKCSGTSCRCESGVCKTYDPCDPKLSMCETLYPDGNRSVCSVVKNQVECDCDQYYELSGKTCVIACEHGTANAEKTECSCSGGYTVSESKLYCQYDCSAVGNSETNSTNDGCSCKTGYMWENEFKQKCIEDPCFTHTCNESNKNRCEVQEGLPVCVCNTGFQENSDGLCLELGKPCEITMDCNPQEVCTVNLLEGALTRFCIPKVTTKKTTGYYCQENSDCQSGFCVPYNEEGDGYCGQFCNACAATDCVHEGNTTVKGACEVDIDTQYGVCSCQLDHVQVGGNCMMIDTEGSSCGENELVIDKSGIYSGNNSLPDYSSQISELDICYDLNTTGGLDGRSVDSLSASEAYYTLKIRYQSRVRIKVQQKGALRDSLIMVRENCSDTKNLFCINDSPFPDFHGELNQIFAPGTYYIIIDASDASASGQYIQGEFSFSVKIEEELCPQSTTCGEETITDGDQSATYRLCKPIVTGGTLCQSKSDCPGEKTCNGRYCQD